MSAFRGSSGSSGRPEARTDRSGNSEAENVCAFCEECWAEAGRRQASGDRRPQISIYYDVLEERADAAHQGSPRA